MDNNNWRYVSFTKQYGTGIVYHRMITVLYRNNNQWTIGFELELGDNFSSILRELKAITSLFDESRDLYRFYGLFFEKLILEHSPFTKYISKSYDFNRDLKGKIDIVLNKTNYQIKTTSTASKATIKQWKNSNHKEAGFLEKHNIKLMLLSIVDEVIYFETSKDIVVFELEDVKVLA